MKKILLPLVVLFLGLVTVPAGAWGPHPEIFKAALRVLPENDPFWDVYGRDLERIAPMSWMGDWAAGRAPITLDGVVCYSPDFLLTPGFGGAGHCYPDVVAAYEPTFRRALQAARTEDRRNALGWLGSLVHFCEDTGAPPHADKKFGPQHAQLENWVDASQIDITGYQPVMLGATDDEALQGYLNRMAALREFALQRAERALPPVVADNRPEAEKIILESADESARALADLLHTLGTLIAQTPADGGRIEGTVAFQKIDEQDRAACKVVLLGTGYSTLSDADGRFAWHSLPPGEYNVAVLRCGNRPTTAKVSVAEGETAALEVKMTPSDPPGNWIRNSDLSVRWFDPAMPDDWTRDPNNRGLWISESFTARPGQTLRLDVQWNEGRQGRVVCDCRNTRDWKPVPVEITDGRIAISDDPALGGRDVMFKLLLYVDTDDPAAAVKSVSLLSEPSP